MDFSWTPEQREYRDVVLRFAQRELGDELIKRDEAGSFSQDAWRKCADFGIQGLPVSKDYGGSEADALTMALAMEALGQGCSDNGLLFSLNAHMWACEHPLSRFGSPELKERYLPGMCDGSIVGAHAMSEPDSGSDAFALATTAVRSGEHFILNGSKTFVSNAPVADVFVVFATTDPARGLLGLCAFIVERGTPGLSVGQTLHKMGLRTSPMAEVFLDDCQVPATNLLGRAGGGMVVFTSAMEVERALILASTVGSMARQLETVVEHARTRRQFGHPIGKNQAVSHRIVDMKLRLETSRLLLYRLAWLMDHQESVTEQSALTKLHLSESYLASALDALQVYGGYGYMTEYELEREVRDAVGSRLYSGTSEIQKNIVARHLKL